MKLKEIHCDSRRDIYVIDGMLNGDKEFSIIKLKKGKAIGGCIHSVHENVCVISGKIWVTYNKDEPFSMTEGESDYIPAETAHMFVAEEDSVILEWGVPESEKLNSVKDHKQRKEVDKINED